jgi:hypothetical protein
MTDAEDDVLGANVAVAQAARLIRGQIEHLPGSACRLDPAQRLALSASNDELDGASNFPRFHAQILKHYDADTVIFADQPEQNMLWAYVIVIEPAGFLRGALERPTSTSGISIQIAAPDG